MGFVQHGSNLCASKEIDLNPTLRLTRAKLSSNLSSLQESAWYFVVIRKDHYNWMRQTDCQGLSYDLQRQAVQGLSKLKRAESRSNVDR